MRVIDLFREWDEDNNGKVTRAEFHKAMPLLGLDVPAAEVDALFDSWDPDGSGILEQSEVQKQLRRGAEITLAADLQDGAVAIETERTQGHELRKGPQEKTTSHLLRGMDIDEGSDRTVAQQAPATHPDVRTRPPRPGLRLHRFAPDVRSLFGGSCATRSRATPCA